MNILAQSIMTQPVITIREDASVGDLLTLLHERQISGVPVTDAAGRLVGVIAVTDVVALGPNEKAEPSAFASDFHTSPAMDGLSRVHHLLKPDEKMHSRRVYELMSHTFISAREDTPICDLAGLMLAHRIHRILILRNARPVGIVSLTDILRTLRDHMPVRS